MKLVVALGGNALMKRGEPLTTTGQWANMHQAARALGRIAHQHQLVLTHGNGPQVGLLAMQSECFEGADTYPFDVMCAATAGMIGYMIEQELGNLLGYDFPIATLLTRVLVDPDDPEFESPSKFIGPDFDEQEACLLARRRGWTFRQDGKHWRRVVPSPEPQAIMGHRPLNWLLAQNAIIICAGGGGIPVCCQADGKTAAGVEAVIDKDRASALLASEVSADLFVIATDVDGVYTDFGTPKQALLSSTTPNQLDCLGFSKGSMGPKVEAACRFVRTTGRPAAIGALDEIDRVVAGEVGTLIEPDSRK